MNYPLGWFFHYCVHGTVKRHLFGILMGLFIQLYMYGAAIGHVFCMSIVTYIMMNSLPRNKQQHYVLVFVLLYLSYQHISRMLMNFGGFDMDVTTYTMLLTCKLSSMAFCYKDGGERLENLNADQQKKIIFNRPSFFETMSYTFFFSTAGLG